MLTDFPNCDGGMTRDDGLGDLAFDLDAGLFGVGTACSDTALGFAHYNHLTGALRTDVWPTGQFQIQLSGTFKVVGAVLQSDGLVVAAALSGADGGAGSTGLLRIRLPSGTLDPSFGPAGAGSNAEQIGELGSRPIGIVKDSSPGKFVIGGDYIESVGNGPFVARFTASGFLDPSFGDGGVVLSPTGQANFGAIGTQGSQFIIGATRSGLLPDAGLGAFGSVTRLTSAGQADLGWGTGGEAVLDENDFVASIISQPDGKIVLGGFAGLGGFTDFQLKVTRLTTTGALDTSFGTGGRFSLNPTPTNDGVKGIALGANGVIGVGSHVDEPLLHVMQLTSAGARDSTFGDGGITQAVGYAAKGFVKVPGGWILAGTGFRTSADWMLMRVVE